MLVDMVMRNIVLGEIMCNRRLQMLYSIALANRQDGGVDAEDAMTGRTKKQGVHHPGHWVHLGLADADQHGSAAAERRRRAAAGSLLAGKRGLHGWA